MHHAEFRFRTIQNTHPRPLGYAGPRERLPNELSDLRALNLVRYENSEVTLLASPDIDAEILMRRAVSEMRASRLHAV